MRRPSEALRRAQANLIALRSGAKREAPRKSTASRDPHREYLRGEQRELAGRLRDIKAELRNLEDARCDLRREMPSDMLDGAMEELESRENALLEEQTAKECSLARIKQELRR